MNENSLDIDHDTSCTEIYLCTLKVLQTEPMVLYHLMDKPLNIFTGWIGKRCEEDEDECSQTPCQNAALCINTPGSFACACQFGE